MKKYEVVNIPGLGERILNDGFFFGYKELVRSGKDIVYYDEPREDGEIKIEDTINKRTFFRAGSMSARSIMYGAGLDYGFGPGIIGTSPIVDLGLGSVMLPYLGARGAYYAAEIWRGYGRRKAKKFVSRKIEDEEFELEDIDLSFLDDIVRKSHLEQKIEDYWIAREDRRESFSTENKIRKHIHFYEDDTMMNLRKDEIYPIIKELEDACFSVNQSDDNYRVYQGIGKQYKKVRKKLNNQTKGRFKLKNEGMYGIMPWKIPDSEF